MQLQRGHVLAATVIVTVFAGANKAVEGCGSCLPPQQTSPTGTITYTFDSTISQGLQNEFDAARGEWNSALANTGRSLAPSGSAGERI